MGIINKQYTQKKGSKGGNPKPPKKEKIQVFKNKNKKKYTFLRRLTRESAKV